MKCPKCGYLGFDTVDRCRNCGYDFSLTGDAVPDAGTPARPRATPLNLPPLPRHETPHARHTRPSRDARAGRMTGALDRPLSRTPDSAPLDLPLFDSGFQPGTPLPPPHRPLAVRRSGPVTPRPRTRTDTPVPVALSLDLDEPPAPAAPAAGEAVLRPASMVGPPAHAARRFAAGFVDLALVVLVDLVTIYFTLRLCGLEAFEWNVLPWMPLATFFIVLNGGYFILLTGTLGQTLGKMAMRIEVVADGRAIVGLGRATVRSAAALLTLLPAGIGMAWALAGDRRTLHDRVSGTRVVQIPAA